jgi:L-fuconolactonase
MITAFRQIDSHVHCWQLSRGDYTWLTPALTPLYRDFLPHDIESIISHCPIKEVILVQAAPTLAETNFLLTLAEQNTFILGVVGWVDLQSEEAPLNINILAKHPKCLGIRPMIQDIPALDWILREELAPGLHCLQEKKLTFDALIKTPHFPYFIAFLERYPHLKIVIDHGAKPNIKENQFQPWADYIKKIAKFSNVYCKLSGLFTECGSDQSWQAVLPYVDHLFSVFGERRMMWGSDFPVLNLASQYSDWYQFCVSYVESNCSAALPWVFGKTAEMFYGRCCENS